MATLNDEDESHPLYTLEFLLLLLVRLYLKVTTVRQ